MIKLGEIILKGYVMPTFFHIFYAVVAFIFGSVVGSFLNVVAYRVPRHESLIKGRSHCTSCNKQIAEYVNEELHQQYAWDIAGLDTVAFMSKSNSVYMYWTD